MKKKSLLLSAVATICLATVTIAQNVPSYVPTNGLVGWWPFNGNANDESGNNNNGTVFGAALTSDRFGNPNKAYSFNSNYLGHYSGADYIRCVNPGPIGASSRTFSFWVKTDSLSMSSLNNCVLSYGKNNSGGAAQQLRVVFGGNCIQGVAATNYSGNREINYIPQNNWDFFTVVYDSLLGQNCSAFRIYLNANLITNYCFDNAGATTNTSNQNPLTFGRYHDLTWVSDPSFFKGFLDDVGVWNRALSQQEISNLYNGNVCYQYVTVTDTLIINTNITGFNPITYQNSIKIFPNPSNDHITIDYGNFATLNGYQLKITNSLGQQMFQTNINQQSSYISLSTWTGNGIYFVHIIDSQGNTIDIRKIVLQ
jgi:hypothetical protein